MAYYLKTSTRSAARYPKNPYPRFSHATLGLRFYSPDISRWLSRDPVGEVGGESESGTLRNNPIAVIDPFGLSACQVSVLIGHDRDVVETFIDVPKDKMSWDIGITCGANKVRGELTDSAKKVQQLIDNAADLPANLRHLDFVTMKKHTVADFSPDQKKLKKQLERLNPNYFQPGGRKTQKSAIEMRQDYVLSLIMDARRKAKTLAAQECCRTECPEGIIVRFRVLAGSEIALRDTIYEKTLEDNQIDRTVPCKSQAAETD